MTSGSRENLELSDIQGNVLRGYGHPHVTHLFGSVEPGSARRWQDALAELAVTFEGQGQKPSVARNVGISHAGMALLVPDVADELNVFEAYASGMGARAALLGDPDDVPWGRWASRHVWIAVHAANETLLHADVARLRHLFGRLLSPTELRGAAMKDAQRDPIEPFGFRDGISQPAIAGSPREGKMLSRGGGRFDAKRKEWSPIAAGEFLLGHANERGRDVLSRLPTIAPMLKNGTFAVFRELVQDVALFERELSAAAGIWQRPVQELKAKLVGRYANGTSLATPDGGTETPFTYDHDPDGARCPLGAHVRRANPRITGEHRLIRRGMPFDRGADDPGALRSRQKGLYFVALNASIENQFEFVQSVWLNQPARSLPNTRDPLGTAGPAWGRMLVEGDADGGVDPIILLNLPRFVTSRGGQYYFVPGRRGLGQITGAS